MQIFVLVLIAALFIHDSVPITPEDQLISSTTLVVIVLAPKILLGIFYLVLCRLTMLRLGTPVGPMSLRRTEKATSILPIATALLYGADLSLGMLEQIRMWLGDMVLLDELLALAPPVGLVVFSWWAYYPIDRRLREALLIRNLDEGGSIHPVWTRSQYIVSQLRHQIGLLLIPMLSLWTWAEFIALYAPESAGWMNHADPRPMLTLAGSVTVFLFTPVVIRHVWDTTPLPPGQLRDTLVAMCNHYRVGVRALLLWRTFGCMVNGAVMGLISPLRYILLTDALLEGLTPTQVEAVMAHEIAHIKKHHVFWLLVVASSALGIFAVAWATAIEILIHTINNSPSATPLPLIIADPNLRPAVAIALATVCWVGVIGWVSRRFERQADSFAVQHLAMHTADMPSETSTQTIGLQPIHVMVSALGQVAELNRVNPSRKSWRHGSIAWRQEYLKTLDGSATDRLPIDRLVNRIKAAAMLSLMTLAFLYWYAPSWL